MVDDRLRIIVLQSKVVATALLGGAILMSMRAVQVGKTVPAADARALSSVAQQADDGRQIQLGGEVSTLLPSEGDAGRLLYAAIGSRIDVFDISDPEQPRFRHATAPMPAQVQAMAIEGDLLYAASFRAGFHIFEGARAGELARLGQLPGVTGSVAAMALLGDRAYITDWNRGLVVIDIEDPTMPRLVDRVDFESSSGSGALQFRDGVLEGERLALVGGDPEDRSQYEIVIIDVAGAREPAEIGRLVVESSNPSGLVWRGEHLYMGSSFGLRVIDVADPASPSDLGLVDPPEEMSVSGLTGAEDRLYRWARQDGSTLLLEYSLAEPARPVLTTIHRNGPWGGIWPHGDWVFSSNSSRIDIYERDDTMLHRRSSTALAGYIANAVDGGERIWHTSELGLHALEGGATSPSLLRWSGEWAPMRIALQSDRLYAAAGDDALQSLDLTDPMAPRELEAVPHTPGSAEVRNVIAAGDHGYAIAWRGRGGALTELWTLDLRPETGPQRIDVLEIEVGWNGMAQLEVVGDILLVSSDGASGGREISAIDITERARPREVFRLEIEDHVWDLAADRGARFYAGTETSIVGYEIIGPPLQIVERSRWLAGGEGPTRSVLGLAVEGDEIIALAARAESGPGGFSRPPIDELGHAAALLHLRAASDGTLDPLEEIPIAAGLGWNVDYQPFVAGRWVGLPNAHMGLTFVTFDSKRADPRLFLPRLMSVFGEDHTP